MYIKYYCASTNYNSCVHCSNLLIRIGESEQQQNVTLGQYSHNRMSSIRKFQMINVKNVKVYHYMRYMVYAKFLSFLNSVFHV